MSGKLDKSLDEILVNRRQGARRGSRRGAKPTAAAPAAGGIRKAKATKAAAKGGAKTATGPVQTEGKILVSGLPSDVSEANIKEYFAKSAGPVKRVILTYNQNGSSRGVANIIFSKPETAAKAAKDLNGLLVDGKPMKIEVIVDASHAPGVPAPKPLTERVAQSKSQPKPATGGKAATAAGSGRRGRRTARRGGRASNRPKPKTTEELDAEMDDYFDTNENGAAPATGAVNGQAQPAGQQQQQQPAAANGGDDVGMAEISESNLRSSPSLPTPSIESSLASNFTFASSGSFSSSLTPKTPPNSLLLDLDPPKAASSAPTTTTTSPTSPCNNAYGQSASSSCAYPSWPNRPSLVSTQTSMSTTTTATTTSTFSTASNSAFISDEELLDTTPLSSPAIEVDQDPCAAAGSTSMTIGSISMSAELRIRHMREQAEEEEDRSRFLAQVQAHARAQLATRMQLPQQQQQQQQQQGGGNAALALRTKQRKAIVPVVGKKRRATSSSSKKGYPRV